MGRAAGLRDLEIKLSAEDRHMKSIHYELKYCEGCGTLELRPVLPGAHHCRVCEHMLRRFRFPRKMLANRQVGLPHLAELKMAAAVSPGPRAAESMRGAQ
jgi:hypothetical protein